MAKTNRYQELGYKNRQEYLEETAAEHGISPDMAFAVADLFGDTEDFDGFVSAMEDAELMGFGDFEDGEDW